MKKFLVLLVVLFVSVGFLGADEPYFLNVPGLQSVLMSESIQDDFDHNGDGKVDDEGFYIEDFVGFYNMLCFFEQGYILNIPGSHTILNEEKIRADFDRAGYEFPVEEFIDFYNELLVRQNIMYNMSFNNTDIDLTYTYDLYGSSCPFPSPPSPQNSELGYGPRRGHGPRR